MAQCGESSEAGDELHVVLHRFAEADPRVDGDVLRPDTRGAGCGHALGEMSGHLGHHIVVVRAQLHGARCALHVHEHDGAPALRGGARHIVIAPQGGDIVDDLRPGGGRGARHRGFRGVDT